MMGPGGEVGEPLCRELLDALLAGCCALAIGANTRIVATEAILILRMGAPFRE